MKVIILRGLPGSGKSTWARRQPNSVLCSADDFFTSPDGWYRFDPRLLPSAHHACGSKFVAHNAARLLNVIVDNTNTTNKEMEHYVSDAELYGQEIEIITFKGQFASVHNVPQFSIERMRKRWQEVKPEWKKYEKEPY